MATGCLVACGNHLATHSTGTEHHVLAEVDALGAAIKNHVRVYKDLPKDYPIEIANKEELSDLEPRPRKRART